MGKRLWFPVWLAFVSAVPSGLFAQTVLNIPRVVSTADVFTGVAIGNPTSAEVTVTFTAYQADGTPLSGGINPVTLTIPAAGQIAQNFSDLFGTKAPFDSWVQVSSAASGLTSFFLNSNYALTDFDGSGVPSPAAEFTLPLAASDGTSITEVTLVNVNADPATAVLTLYGSDGHPLSTANTSLTARGLIRQTLMDLFGAQVDITSASHIRVNADRPIVGYEVVVNYLVSGNGVRRETASVSGQGMTPATSYVLPRFVTAGDWLSLLGVVNGAGVSQQVTLTAYKDDGTLWNSPSNPTTFLLGGNAGLRTTVRELFGFTDDALRTGWIQVTGSVGFLLSYVASGNTATPSFALVTGTDVSAASRYEAFSQVAEGAGQFTSLSIVNPGTSPANIELYTLRPDGSVVGKSTFTLGPNQQTGGLLRDLLPASLNQVGGWAFLRSSQPIVGSALFGTVNGAALSGIPPELAPSNFQPPAQTIAAITGSALSGDKGIGGVQMKLSGPVMATTVTDDRGRYVFTQLPAGNYQVTPALPGAQFSPVLQGVTLGLQNADGKDFQVGGLQPADVPQIQVVSPGSTFAGSGSFSVRVLGNNFAPVSLISINGQTLDTVFVDRTELRAVLPSTLSAQPGKLTVSVITPPPGGGSSPAMDFTVVAAPQNPLIAGRAAAGAFPSGVAIDNTRNTALVTNQSGDNVSVVDLTSMQILTEIPAGRSPAEGIAIDKVNDVAVVANPGSDNVTVIDLKTNSVTATIPVGSFPIGVAIDARKGRTLVVSGGTDKVDIVDLNSLTANGNIPVGSRPAGIAINPKTNQAVVTNRGGNTVTVIDLNSDTVLGSIGVGTYPRGVAINPETNQAVVANANGGTASIIDLSTRAVIATVNVGVGPTGVAIHPLTNMAIVTNSGASGGSTALPPQTTVSIISLTSQAVVATVPVGSAAFGVDVHQGNQVAVVADYGSNDITLVRIPNPKPRVDDVQPKALPIGGGSLTTTVTGAGFLPASVVTLNGQPLPTSYVSSTELRAEISSPMLNQALQAGAVVSHAIRLGEPKGVFAATAPLQLTVGVSNPGPGGGDSANPSGGTTNQLQVQNPVPVLLSMSPTSIPADRDLTLVINGNNFNATSIVNFGGSQFAPASASATSIIINIPHDQFKAGTVQVSVTNPPLGGGTSSPLTFRIDDRQNPAPLLLSVTPSSTPTRSGPLTMTVQGNGFINSTQGSLGGVNGTVSGDTIRFNLTADLTQNAGTLTGVITNPSPGGGSAVFSFNVLNAVPVVTGYTPVSAVTGTTVTLTVNGTDFARDSVITIEGTRISTTFVSTTSLTAVIPEAFMRIAGQVQIGVTNPPPGGGSVAAGRFSITNPRPVLTAVTPASVTIQSTDLSVQLTGAGFSGNSVASINGVPISATYNSATSLTATIPGRLLQQTGLLSIVVTNPPPGGGTSDPASLPVLNPVPVIAAVSPAQLTGDQQDAVLTVTGQNFVNGATILIGKQTLQTTFVSAIQLTAPFPPPLPLGRQTITVVNPTPGGGTSNEFTIQIRALKPVISVVNPVPASPGQTISIVGTNFGVGSIVVLRGLALSTTVTSSTALKAVIPIDASTGPADLTVQNPATSLDLALTSAPFTIQIVNPLPVITSLDPSTVQALQADPLTIHGSGFLQTSQAQVNGQAAVTAFVDAGTLTFTLPSNAAGGSANVTVVNPQPGGGTSNTAVLTVTNPTPTLISLNPSTFLAELVFTLTVTGTNFVNGAVINFGPVIFPATVINSTTLFANLSGISPGDIDVSVTNPGGLTSNALTVTLITRPGAPPVSTCAAFPAGLTPFDSVSYLTPPNDAGDRLVVGVSHYWSLDGVPLPNQPNQQYCGFVQLASGLSVKAYVTTPDERNGIFSAFSSQFPNGILPSGIHAWRISSVAPPTLSQITPSSGIAGQMVNVTLTGTNFVPGGTSVSGNGTGQGHGLGIVSMSPTSITGTVLLLGPSGSSEITVATFAGTSAPIPFTVNPNALNTTGFTVSTFAGSAGSFGSTNAMGTSARFSSIGGLAGDAYGNLLVADTNNNIIRKIALGTQVVSTLTAVAPSAGPPVSFSNPGGIWSDGSNLYIADTNNATIRQMIMGTGVVTTLVSSGIFTSPSGIWGDGANLYVTDTGDHTIRKVDIASGRTSIIAGIPNSRGSVDGPLVTSMFSQPQGVWGDHHNLYVSDTGNHTIRMISMTNGQVSTIAGSVGVCGLMDGSRANFCHPKGLWGDGTQLFIADSGNNAIRSLQLSTGMVVSVAGSGSSGSMDGSGNVAQFCSPSAIWGDGTSLYVADSGNDTLRRLAPAGP